MINLTFYYSTMNAGKTMEVIKTAFDLETENIATVIFTSITDTRSGPNKVTSRMGLERDAISIFPEDDLYQKVNNEHNNVEYIFVDEVQFFTIEQIWQLFNITHQLQIPVICYGLRGDFMGKPFPASAQLMAIANEIKEIESFCWCKRKAIINARIIDGKVMHEGEQIMVGGNDTYKKLCSVHWLEGRYKR